MTKSKNYQRPQTIMFDDATHAMSQRLAAETHTTVSQVVRTAIRSQYAMMVDRRPTCATGHACHCPHTHTYPPA